MNFDGPKEAPEVKELGQKSPEPSTRVDGAPYPMGTPPYLVDDPETPPDVRPTPKIPTNTETPRNKPRLGVLPPQASIATENQSRPVPAPCRRGESLSDGHLHHPGALHDEEE